MVKSGMKVNSIPVLLIHMYFVGSLASESDFVFGAYIS